MIYILLGNDTKKKNTFLKKLYKDNIPIFASGTDLSKELLFEKTESVSLFGEKTIMVLDSPIKEGDLIFSVEDLQILKESQTTFVFLEEKLLAMDLKKYKKFAEIENFTSPETKISSKVNVFGIADAFSRRDKIGTWVLYRDAVTAGVSPEEISGIIFWKIKMMILNGNKIFSINELKSQSSLLVSLYHRAHRGEIDFIIGLEQFILSSLNKN